LTTRFENSPQLHLDDADFARLGSHTVREGIFDPAESFVWPEELGFNPTVIAGDRKCWKSTSPDAMTLVQQCLVNVLIASEDWQWNALWIASLYRAHTIISDDAQEHFYYVAGATSYCLLAWQLHRQIDGYLYLELDVNNFRNACGVSHPSKI
jgi:hypothetical protein